MTNYLRKAASLLALAGACFGAWHLGDSAGAAVDTITPAAEWLTDKGYTVVEPSQCQADALSDVRAQLTAKAAWQGEWLWASDLDSDSDAWGLTWHRAQRVALDTSVPCDMVASVAIHEWVHVVVGNPVDEELAADCTVARLAPVLAPSAAVYTPYLDKAGVCSDAATATALDVLASHGLLSGGSE